MATIEMDYADFMEKIQNLLPQLLAVADNRRKNYKRGEYSVQMLQQMNQVSNLWRADRPPTRIPADANFQTEKAGNPMFFHKIVIQKNVMGHVSFNIGPMSDKEAANVAKTGKSR